MKIGIPRAGMYYRCGQLWLNFFKELNIETVVSPKTNKAILDAGSAAMADESCLASKIYMGHVKYLIDKCDMLFIPWISNFGADGINCTRFRALNAITANVFRKQAPKILAYAIDYSGTQDMKNAGSEEEAFVSMHGELNKTPEQVRFAYLAAKKEADKHFDMLVAETEKKCLLPAKKVLIVGHDYNIYDEYAGKPVTDSLKALGIEYIDANKVNRKEAQQLFLSITDTTLPWTVSRELLGGIVKYRNSVDGIILLTGFPCGPDSIVNDLIARKVSGLPQLSLLLDGQDGLAGIETRIESFADILMLKTGEETHNA